MIHSAIFDIGMVLLRFDFNHSVRRLKDRCKVKPHEIAEKFFESGLVDAYDRGRIGTPEFARQASSLIGFQGTDDELIHAWSDIFSPNEPMMERVRNWKRAGMKLYFLSNTCEAHIEFFVPRYEVFSLFDGGIYSCRVGCAKPEPAIYDRILKDYGLVPRETVFIDDRLENVIASRQFHIHGLHYEDDASLTRDLKALGLD